MEKRRIFKEFYIVLGFLKLIIFFQSINQLIIKTEYYEENLHLNFII